MSNETAIGWTDYSSNPIKYRNNETGKVVWACVKKSAGCTNCYSEALALRWNKGLPFARPNIDKVTPFLDDKEMKRLASDPKLSGKRVFIGDMTDIFGSWVPDDFLDRLFAVFAWRQDVTFQCLTKRPERMEAWFREAFQFSRTDGGIGWSGRQERVFEAMQDLGVIDPFNDEHWEPDGSYKWPGWPLPNVWLGTSVEHQAAADERIPRLLKVPAVVRFLSCEPLLGPVSLFAWDEDEGALRGPGVVISGGMTPNTADYPAEGYDDSYVGLDWVIVGGESGPRYREMNLDWLARIVSQCRDNDVAVFTKQASGSYPGRQGGIPAEYWLHEFPGTPLPAAEAAHAEAGS